MARAQRKMQTIIICESNLNFERPQADTTGNSFAVEAYFSRKCGIEFKDPVQSKREADQALHCGGVHVEGV